MRGNAEIRQYYNSAAAAKLYPSARCLLQTADPYPMETILRGLHREIQTHPDDAAVALWVHLLHTSCLRLLKDPLKNRFSLQPLWLLVERNLAYPWDMKLLSKKAGMSAEHLRRLAWAEIGCSPIKHVTSLRMRQATLLFQATGLNGFRGRRSGGIEKCVCLQHSLPAANRFQPWGFLS